MISNYLKTFRERARLTQSELADAAGVQTQTVWRWEHGEREPSLSLIKKTLRDFILYRIRIIKWSVGR